MVIPDKLRHYYEQFDIDIGRVLSPPKETHGTRFVRLNPRFGAEETLTMLRNELSKEAVAAGFPKLVPWLQQCSSSASFSWGFYAVPAEFRLSRSQVYQSGRIYGQDVSSGAAVANLMMVDNKQDAATTTQAGLRILDLCCAPGLKLCAVADWLEQNATTQSVVVGVDLSESRLDVTKRVLHKYHIHPATSRPQRTDDTAETTPSNKTNRNVVIRLYKGDGTTFMATSSCEHTLVFDSNVARDGQAEADRVGRKRPNKSSRARAKKRLKLLQQEESDSPNNDGDTQILFDAVLVDAECSTDGSLKHVQKWLQPSSGSANSDDEDEKQCPTGNINGGILPLLEDPTKMDRLVDLQKRLAIRGFDLLKPGGVMVYSTCSLSPRQNEEVVEALLEARRDSAQLIPIDVPGRFGSSSSRRVQEGSTRGTIRFLPNIESSTEEEVFGGGFFLARIQKKQTKKEG